MVLPVVWLGLLLTAGCDGAEAEPEPSPTGRGGIELVPDDRDTEAMAVAIVSAEADLVSHAFNDGVLQLGVRGERAAVDARLRLCDRLVDEFRDSPALERILVTAARAPLVHWNSGDARCVADAE
ncbi:hypothetical protein Ade02nite_28050 [Paractinoplanes deccanensis]|uniref:Uncharacterized protein n=1 Tax=Paractinoplanes deccanensis TaxID=113561 RepID=A0ABQ3Y2D9_9ACTN|nr:hypothetical protein Ade02nite_28050 [Actinoplanes deccanensis]